MSAKLHWLVRPSSIKKLWILLYVCLGLSLLAEVFISHEAHFNIEASFGFSAWFGLGSCILMVIVAKLLGVFIKRKDNYYKDNYYKDNYYEEKIK